MVSMQNDLFLPLSLSLSFSLSLSLFLSLSLSLFLSLSLSFCLSLDIIWSNRCYVFQIRLKNKSDHETYIGQKKVNLLLTSSCYLLLGIYYKLIKGHSIETCVTIKYLLLSLLEYLLCKI